MLIVFCYAFKSTQEPFNGQPFLTMIVVDKKTMLNKLSIVLFVI